MLPIATSEAHVGLMGRRHCKYRLTVNASYILYKHYFNLSCNCVILSTNKGVNYTSLLFIHGPSKAFLAQTMIFALSPSKYCIVNGSENKKTTTLIWMSEWLLFKAKWAICELYHGDNKLHSSDGQRDAVLMLPITTSEAHVGLMGRRHCKYRITVNVSYISYKHYFNLSCNCVILSTNKSDCWIRSGELYVSYIMATTSYIRWDYNDVGFVLDQHA
jgi:transcription elongation factor Elf1